MSYARAFASGSINKPFPEDGAAHDWYRFVLSYPPHLVRDYVRRFGLTGEHRVLDPFCGTGTTLVECKKLGIPSVGIEANPMAHFASVVKADWSPSPEGLVEHARQVAGETLRVLQNEGIPDDPAVLIDAAHTYRTLTPEGLKLLLKDSISARPLHKALVLLDVIKTHYDPQYNAHELLALAKALVFSVSNLHFGPEVGVNATKKLDAAVVAIWQANVLAMANDLRELKAHKEITTKVHKADARQLTNIIEPLTSDAVITSPPYPNEKDYTRTTRLESVLLGFINNKAELQALKRGLMRSNTRNVYKGDADDAWVAEHKEIQSIVTAIETRRPEHAQAARER